MGVVDRADRVHGAPSIRGCSAARAARGERRFLDPAALDPVDERVDGQREELGAELGGRLRRPAGHAVGRQHRRGVAEHERAGAIGVVGVAEPVEVHELGRDVQHQRRLGAVRVHVVAVGGHLGGHGGIERPPVRDADAQVGAEQPEMVGRDSSAPRCRSAR